MQIVLTGKNKKNITYLSSAELAQKAVTDSPSICKPK